jgi:hypothetical protein
MILQFPNPSPLIHSNYMIDDGVYGLSMSRYSNKIAILMALPIHRYTKTHPNASPHDMQTAKHFVEFLACGAEGIDSDKPNVSSVRMYWRQFVSAWNRRAFNPISKEATELITYVCFSSHLLLESSKHLPFYIYKITCRGSLLSQLLNASHTTLPPQPSSSY